MPDPREVDERCPENIPGPDLLRRHYYRCHFRKDHEGLHYGAAYVQGDHLAVGDHKAYEGILRWGDEARLHQEFALLHTSMARD